MDTAFRFAKLSSAKNLQVGCIIVKDGKIISIGYNGTPKGWNNTCEDKNGVTKPEVIHAESNALLKLAREGDSGFGASLFVTHSPCIDCAKLIYQAGIKEVYYSIPYRDKRGLNFLKDMGITTEQFNHE